MLFTLPRKPASVNQVGSLFVLSQAASQVLALPRHRGLAITAASEDGLVEVTAVDFDTIELAEQHGPMDRMVTGVASPYAQPYNVRVGAFLLQRWLVWNVAVSVLQEHCESAGENAAVLVFLHLNKVDEPDLLTVAVEHRRVEQAAWKRLFDSFA